MQPFTIGIIIFLTTFIIQMIRIIQNRAKAGMKTPIHMILAFVISVVLGIMGFVISAVIYLGTDLSI